ncbi:MAG TPA: hypothetical protein VEC16_02060 [Alphaproteobacteria bacterium]|nr:hypothetical protein [Alphaproteobacteria bacterium]
MEKNSILRYFQENLSNNITQVNINKSMIPDESIFEEIIGELGALDLDKDTGNAENQVALLLSNPQIRKDIQLEKNVFKAESESKHLYNPRIHKKSLIEKHSKNYSSNVPLQKYMELFNVPSIKKIEFSPLKSGLEIDFFSDRLEYSKPHQYRIERSDKITIDLILRNETYNTNTEEKSYLSITIEDKNIPKYRPSKIITKNFHLTKKEWPYPNINYDKQDAVQNHEIKESFANISWKDMVLVPGEFNYNMWKLFCMVIEDNSFMKKGVELCDDYREKINSQYKPFQIVEGFEVPIGEINLKIGTNLRLENIPPTIDVEFEYKQNNSFASLYIKEIDINPKPPEKYILEPDIY